MRNFKMNEVSKEIRKQMAKKGMNLSANDWEVVWRILMATRNEDIYDLEQPVDSEREEELEILVSAGIDVANILLPVMSQSQLNDLADEDRREFFSNDTVQMQFPTEELTADDEDNRMQVQLIYYTIKAELKPEVINIRKFLMNDCILTYEEMLQFLNSPATANWSPNQFHEQAINILRHEALILSERVTDKIITKKTSIIPRMSWNEYASPGKEVEFEVNGVRQHVEVKPGSKCVDIMVPYNPGNEQQTYAHILDDKCFKHLTVYDGSVLFEFAKLADIITKEFGWHRYYSLRFLLTKEIPIDSPLTCIPTLLRNGVNINNDIDWRIGMDICPWISPDTVRQTYVQAQRFLKGKDVHKTRNPDAKNMSVFILVSSWTKDGTERERWSTLCSRWNEWFESGKLQETISKLGLTYKIKDDWKYQAARGKPAEYLFRQAYERTKNILTDDANPFHCTKKELRTIQHKDKTK